MLETLHCLNDAEDFLKSTEKDMKALIENAHPKLKEESKADFSSKLESKNSKYCKNIKAIKKRLENSMKEERRNYTLSNFTNNPYYGNDIFNEHADTIEEEDKTITIKLDRNMIWNLENKLSNVLKRSVELYKSNIIEKQPFEKMKVLKFSQILQDSINELLTIGVGIRDNDTDCSSTKIAFKQWDDFVETNIHFKTDPSQLSRDEKDVYLSDSATENLWEIAQWGNSKNKEKKSEFFKVIQEIQQIERADKAKVKICQNQIRLLRACFTELYDEVEILKRKAKTDINKLINKVENKLDQNFADLERTLDKCSINEDNENKNSYIELYSIFKHLQPQIREAINEILEAKEDQFQNVFGINSKIKELFAQEYFID